MNADLERLIALQRLDSAAHDAQRRLAEEPERLKAFDARLESPRAAVATAQGAPRRQPERPPRHREGRRRAPGPPVEVPRPADGGQDERRIPGDAEGNRVRADRSQDARRRDSRADARGRRPDRGGQARRRRSSPPSRRRSTPTGRRYAAELDGVREHARADHRRAGGAGALALDPQVLALFELVSKRRNGVAVAEARDGICTICHVRLRPQVFNTVRRNDEIIQCDHCNRILYFVPVARRQPRRLSCNASRPMDRRVHRRRRRGNPGPAGFGVRDRTARRHAGRGIQRVDRRRDQQRRGIPRPARRARVGPRAR